MAHLVPKMTEQGAIGLAKPQPRALALGVVRLDQVQRDHAAVVAGHDLRVPLALGRGVVEEIEREALLAGYLLRLGLERRTESDQLVEQAALGRLDLGPPWWNRRLAQIGDRSVV